METLVVACLAGSVLAGRFIQERRRLVGNPAGQGEPPVVQLDGSSELQPEHPLLAQAPSSLDGSGTTWWLSCPGCPKVTITLWSDGEFWIRRGTRGPGAEIFHGRWTRSDSTREASRLSLFVDDRGTPTLVLEQHPAAMRLLKTDRGWPEGIKPSMALARAQSVDLIDDETTFTGTWSGSVHDMREWTDCRSGEHVTVERQGRGQLVPPDSAFALHGRYRHWIGETPPPPPEWGVPKASRNSPARVLQHAFVAERIEGGLDRKKCPHFT